MSIAPTSSTALSNCIPRCDRELLQSFLEGHDQAAFAEIVYRYHALVLGVCRRVLGNRAEAEEAYQATFMVLARRAHGLQWNDWISGWLYQTAYRTAIRHRRKLAVDARHQRTAQSFHEDIASENFAPDRAALLSELGQVLDTELMQLPESLRVPLQLQLFEGLDRTEISERLGISLGAVKDRLERSKEMLRSRLGRRGFAFSLVALAAWFGSESSACAAAASLTQSTAQAATAFAVGSAPTGIVSTATVSLAQGVLGMFFYSKAKLVAAGLAAALFVSTAAYGLIMEHPDRFQKAIRGYVQSVEHRGDVHRVTLLLDEFEIPLSLDIDPKATVRQAFAESRLEDLKPGTYVGLRLKDDHRTVKEIHALGRTEQVIVVAANSGSTSGGKTRTLKVHLENDDIGNEEGVLPNEQSLPLADKAILQIGRLPAHFAHIQPGMTGQVEYGPNSDQIHCVELEPVDGQIIEGVIIEASKDLTVQVESESVWGRQQLHLSNLSILRCDGIDIDASSLRRGQQFQARLSSSKPDAIEALIVSGEVSEEDLAEWNEQQLDDDPELDEMDVEESDNHDENNDQEETNSDETPELDDDPEVEWDDEVVEDEIETEQEADETNDKDSPPEVMDKEDH